MRIAVLDDYQGVAAGLADWASLGPDAELVCFPDHLAEPAALAARLAGFDVVVAMRERTPLDAERLALLPDLRLLVTTGSVNAAIDVAAAAAQGILVCGTDARPAPTAELTWALILAALRHVPAEDAGMRAGGWQHTLGGDLEGATLGVIGLGRLGLRVARIGLAFGMEVVAWSQNLEAERAAAAGVRAVPLDALLGGSDVVTIHQRLSDRTRGLIGAAQLGAMRPSAWLVNTSRGPIVDEAALVAALHAGTIAGAALDVYDVEPLPGDHPLRRAPNTVLTPHLGYVTAGTYEVFFAGVVEAIAGWRDGAPVRVIAAPL